MIYILKRIDGEKDNYTKKEFKSYDEAYNFLEEAFGQSCCSDCDYEQNYYYQIQKKFE
tara:strand:- start:361 stop:534 length:174 start_codon:yes stop_codon:yes gene_type:complete